MATADSFAADLNAAADTNMTEAEREAALQRLRRFATLMDSAVSVPGTSVTMGLESLIGLVPVAGDFAGGLLSCYVLFEGWRLGVPTNILLRMIGNILLEVVVGSVPVIGDAFDVAFKANVRNVQMLERYLSGA